MPSSAEVERLTSQLQVLSENYNWTIQEMRHLHSLNASLAELAHYQRSVIESTSYYQHQNDQNIQWTFASESNNQLSDWNDECQWYQIAQDSPEWQPALLQQMIKASELALNSHAALEQSIGMKDREIQELQQQIRDQEENQTNEMKLMYERISQLSRLVHETYTMKHVERSNQPGYVLTNPVTNQADKIRLPLIDWNKSESPAVEQLPNRTIFVSCLPETIQLEVLKKFYGAAGTIDDIDIRVKPGTAYAFITYRSVKSVLHAKKVLSKMKICGCQVFLEYAEPVNTNWICIDGLSSLDLRQVKLKFGEFGSIQETDYVDGESRAFIQYKRINEARFAVMEMNGASLVPGQSLRVCHGNGEESQANQEDQASSQSSESHENDNFMEQRSEVASSTVDIRSQSVSVPSTTIKLYPLGSFHQIRLRKHSINERTIYVSKLDPDVQRETLRFAFSKFGNIKNINIKRKTGYKKYAFAFVTFQTVEMANEAKLMSGELIGNRRCEVEDKLKSSQICVEGLPLDVSETLLRTEFQKFGEIQSINYAEGNWKAFIRYCKITGAKKAVKEMNGMTLAAMNEKLVISIS